MILAIDPGREKCGMAILGDNGSTIEKTIVPRPEIIRATRSCLAKFPISNLIIGQGAFGREIEKELIKEDSRPNIVFVDEKNSSLEAQKRYWQANQPKGFWKLIPTSFRVPPVPIDDYAAQILGERYLKG